MHVTVYTVYITSYVNSMYINTTMHRYDAVTVAVHNVAKYLSGSQVF